MSNFLRVVSEHPNRYPRGRRYFSIVPIPRQRRSEGRIVISLYEDLEENDLRSINYIRTEPTFHANILFTYADERNISDIIELVHTIEERTWSLTGFNAVTIHGMNSDNEDEPDEGTVNRERSYLSSLNEMYAYAGLVANSSPTVNNVDSNTDEEDETDEDLLVPPTPEQSLQPRRLEFDSSSSSVLESTSPHTSPASEPSTSTMPPLRRPRIQLQPQTASPSTPLRRPLTQSVSASPSTPLRRPRE
jgi:hypothetical protein